MVFDLEGVIDLHVHAGPDVTTRAGDDIEIARLCASAGMAGMAVKAHVEGTASRAYHTNLQVPSFRYIGGVCLNLPVGGINPAAVEASFLLGGRIVWMPSGHSRFHAELMGELGHWHSSGMTLPTPPGAEGISILRDGVLTPETKQVVALVKEHRGLIGTSHLAPHESLELVRYCAGEGVKTLVTHIGWTPAYDADFAVAAAGLGASIEFTSSSIAGHRIRFPIDEAIALMKRLTPMRVVIASDTGGTLSPLPHEALRVFAANLLRSGVSEEDLRTAMCANPLELVDG